MHFTPLTLLTLTALSAAHPTSKRQTGASVLGNAAYNDISISGGTAGNALAEALAVFANLDTANPENISTDDQDTLNQVNQVANDAETSVFNPAIDAATGDAAQALQNGKIKNKVLKLEATILKLQAQQAQGKDVAAKLADEQKKLDNNVALDKKAAGQASTFLPFEAQITGKGPAIATAGNTAAAGTGAAAATDDAAAATGGKAKKGKNARAVEEEVDDEEDDDEVEAEAEDVDDDEDDDEDEE